MSDLKIYFMNFLKFVMQWLRRNIIRREFTYKFISNDFGYGRGIPVDRYYIHKFFLDEARFVTGSCLEFGDTTYIDKYGKEVTKKTTFNYSSEPLSLDNNLAGDITKLNTLPEDVFDCIVSVNVLNFIYDLPAAVLGLKKMIKPSGKILLTLAGVSSHISRYDMDRWGDYWRLTDKATIKLLEDAGFTIEAKQVYGNPYSCTAQMNGFSSEELVQSKLFPSHPDYQLIISFVLRK
jgi:hypothetical protein